jgi:hypothetical protein
MEFYASLVHCYAQTAKPLPFGGRVPHVPQSGCAPTSLLRLRLGDLTPQILFPQRSRMSPPRSTHGVNKLVWLNLQAFGESHYCQEADVGLSTLKRPHIVSVELCHFRELFLREPSVLSKSA